jgi:PAP2 superfamily
MAINDSLIASYASKYHYDYWRPENAIRFLGNYGNSKTTPDPTWLPYIGTPCFPSYPSNHASASTGGAEMLRLIYGRGPHYITISNPYNSAVANLSMRYLTVYKILDDVDDARVFGGVHFRFDQTAGRTLGRSVARDIYANNLKRSN